MSTQLSPSDISLHLVLAFAHCFPGLFLHIILSCRSTGVPPVLYLQNQGVFLLKLLTFITGLWALMIGFMGMDGDTSDTKVFQATFGVVAISKWHFITLTLPLCCHVGWMHALSATAYQSAANMADTTDTDAITCVWCVCADSDRLLQRCWPCRRCSSLR